MKNRPLHSTYYILHSALAFTLIELLIVIGIIIVLAVAGIASYSTARQNIAVDLETDKLVALLHTLREQSRTGAECAGITFEKGETPSKIEAAYKNKIQKCAGKVNVSDVILSPEIVLTELNLDEAARDVFSVTFIPPHGTAQFAPEGEEVEIILSVKSKFYLSRTILINRATGKIEKETN
ncbi:hypothetical protein HZC21_01225 [Candidatus Peregrinibacteria bacterium]|nr:hypothetical protein [Candidatus Peregrinibacteria bacterium]